MQDLFRKYLDNQCSPEEVKQLLVHFHFPENEELLRSLIRESLDSDVSSTDNTINSWTQATAETFNRIKKQMDVEKVMVVPFFKKTWFRVAASVVIIFSVLGYLLFQNKQQKEIAETKIEKKF